MPTQARLYDFDAADPLAQDLKKRGLDCLTLRIRFPPDVGVAASPAFPVGSNGEYVLSAGIYSGTT